MRSAPSSTGTLFVRGARQLLTLRGPVPRRGLACTQLGLIRDGSLLIEGGRISEVGSTRRIENLRDARGARVLDVRGKVVIPGLVDTHMRASSAPPALRAFEQRIAGLPDPPETPPERPTGAVAARRERAQRWLRLAVVGGATTLELHSGGDLAAMAELRALRALAKQAGRAAELSVGFSATPPLQREMRSEARLAVLARIREILAKAAGASRIATTFHLDCGDGWFDWDTAKAAMQYARELGYRLKVRAGGGRGNAGARLAVQIGAASAEGLEGAADSDIELLASSSTVATLIPALAAHLSSRRFAPARRLLDRGAAVSLASGFSPDLHPGFGLQAAMAIACRELEMMPEEAIACCTINAAFAAGRAEFVGSLEPAKHADLAIFDVDDYREVPYFFGVNLCSMTIKRGRIVHSAHPLQATSGARQ